MLLFRSIQCEECCNASFYDQLCCFRVTRVKFDSEDDDGGRSDCFGRDFFYDLFYGPLVPKSALETERSKWNVGMQRTDRILDVSGSLLSYRGFTYCTRTVPV